LLLVPLVFFISDQLRRIIATPIERLATVAHTVATKKDYSVRADAHGPDEIGRLTATFNEMLGTIEERNRALVQQAEDLARSNQELEQFAYVSSHDLQEPLRKITTYAQLLEEKYRDNLEPETKKFIENIGVSVARMRNLINALLTYSRLDKSDQKSEPIDLNQIVREVMSDMESVIAEKKVTIVRDPLPTVQWNAFHAQQIFQNLLGNAVKFQGAEPPLVLISCVTQEQEWLLSVRDNGIGIDKQYSDQIFKVFQRLHPRHVYPGTGIGLAICKKIVEQRKGRIWVESETGKGSTFYFTLPRTDFR
jgi:light-regulated signal transduction histidine kinase (bacteriophytochrome)